MVSKIDKRVSNYIIAVGYCLVAVIILFNYLGQPSLKIIKDPLKPVADKVSSKIVTTESDSIHHQLEEQKRVNQEMREMLRRLQKDHKSKKAPGNKTVISVSSSNFEIPELDDSVIKSLITKRVNPFIKKRNPFIPIHYQKLDQNPETPAVVGRPLKADANLPFIISGANTKARFISNY